MPFDANVPFRITCENEPSRRDMLKIVMIYAVLASTWILASDHLLREHFDDPTQLIAIGVAKGLLFVAFTSGLLMFLLNKLATRLAQRELALTLITDQAGDALLIFDALLRVTYANPAACRMSGYDISELQGHPVARLLPEKIRAGLPSYLERLSQKSSSRGEWLLLSKDGSQKIIDVTMQRLPDGRYLAIGRGLSQSREAQIQINRERHHLKTLVNAIPDAVWLKDTDGTYLAGNPVLEEYLGRHELEFLGLTDHDLFAPEVAGKFLNSDRQVLASRQPQSSEQCWRHPDGSLRQLETSKTPVFDAGGQVIGVLGIAHDVTLAKAAQEALKESEKRFRTLFENASDAVFVMDTEARFCNVNQRACDSLGYSRQELLGMTVADIDLDCSIEELREIWHKPHIGEGITIYRQHRRADGSTFPVEVRLSRYDVDEQAYFLALTRDITEREQTLKALQSSEEFSRAVLDSASSQVAVLDREGCIVAVNESWRRFARERTSPPIELANTAVGINFLDVCRSSQGPYSEAAMAAYQGVLGVLRGDADHFCLDCPCHSANEQLWFIMNVTPLRSDSGGAVVTYLDITEIKHAQAMRERATSQLKALAGKHVSIQEEERRLLSMEIHDQVGQMLTGLKLMLGTLQRKCAELPPTQALLSRANEIVDCLLDTTRDISRRLRPPMLDDLGLMPAVRWHVHTLTIPNSVRVSLDDNLREERLAPAIELACFRLVQEGVSNALRHSRASEITVSFRLQANRLQLSIDDNGMGFDVEETFRKSENLTSLGLLGMRERVAGLDGDFQLRSTPGAGTSLTASFPLASPA